MNKFKHTVIRSRWADEMNSFSELIYCDSFYAAKAALRGLVEGLAFAKGICTENGDYGTLGFFNKNLTTFTSEEFGHFQILSCGPDEEE